MRLRQSSPVGPRRPEAQAQIINHLAHATQAVAEALGGFPVGDRACGHLLATVALHSRPCSWHAPRRRIRNIAARHR